MKWLLLGIVHAYRHTIRRYIRRPCLFKESCSDYVLRATHETGFLGGMRALLYRFSCCRGGYRLVLSPEYDVLEVHLVGGTILDREEASQDLICGLNK